jgi:hypothetical protein
LKNRQAWAFPGYDHKPVATIYCFRPELQDKDADWQNESNMADPDLRRWSQAGQSDERDAEALGMMSEKAGMGDSTTEHLALSK